MLYWDAKTCSRMQVPYRDAGTSTGIHIPILGCRYCKRNVGSSTGMQVLYWDVATTLRCGYQYQDADTYTGIKVPYQDVGTSTGIPIPVLG